jgi:hypothetical protein
MSQGILTHMLAVGLWSFVFIFLFKTFLLRFPIPGFDAMGHVV